ncbi:MAG: BMC domain-containing protein [Acidimicrobiales bacterium]
MARAATSLESAIGLLELDSIAIGVVCGDAMVKSSPVAIHTGTVHPGRYLVLVSGDAATVGVALEVGLDAGGDAVVDSVFLADVHPDVIEALVGSHDHTAEGRGEAVAVVETATVAAAVDAADAGVKAAAVDLATLRMADGLGGKGYLVFAGSVAEAEAALQAAAERLEVGGQLLRTALIAQLSDEMRRDLAADLRFGARVASEHRGPVD